MKYLEKIYAAHAHLLGTAEMNPATVWLSGPWRNVRLFKGQQAELKVRLHSPSRE